MFYSRRILFLIAVFNLQDLRLDELSWSWCNNRNTAHSRSNVLESSPNCPLPRVRGKIVSHKTGSWCQKVGDPWKTSEYWGTAIPSLVTGAMPLSSGDSYSYKLWWNSGWSWTGSHDETFSAFRLHKASVAACFPQGPASWSPETQSPNAVCCPAAPGRVCTGVVLVEITGDCCAHPSWDFLHWKPVISPIIYLWESWLTTLSCRIEGRK